MNAGTAAAEEGAVAEKSPDENAEFKTKLNEALKALNDYAERIGRTKNPLPGDMLAWAAHLNALLTAYDGVTKRLLSSHRSQAQRLYILTRENLPQD